MAKIKKDNNVRFFMHKVPHSMFHFNSYVDENGNEKFLNVGRDNNGNIIKPSIKFHGGKRVLSIPRKKTDNEGNSFYEFIKNSPFCKGSSLCEGEGMFYEFDPQKDAKASLEEAKVSRKAENHALEVQGEKLVNLAIMVNCLSPDEDIMRDAVFQYARKNPRKFIEMSDSPDLSYYSLLTGCMQHGIIKKRGMFYEMPIEGQRPEPLGSSEEAALKKIQNDEILYGVLKNKLEESLI